MAQQEERSHSAARHALAVFGKVIKWVLLVLLTAVLVAVATAYFALGHFRTYVEDSVMPQAEEMQTVLDAQSVNSSLSSTIYYETEDGWEVLDTLYGSENRIWVEYDDIPENLVNATVAIEDKRFWEHDGVDWRRTLAAGVYMFTGTDVQGGSTITQQLIKNLSENNDVTVRRKVTEIFAALIYDANHEKTEIMENYLNYIYLGRQCYGVYTASYRYFDKDVSELDLAECACLISITNNPSLYDPFNHPENNKKRASTVLRQMYIQEMITEQEEIDAMAEIGYLPDGEVDEEGYAVFTYHPEADQLEFYTGTSQTLTGSTTTDEIHSWYEDALINEVRDDLMELYGVTANAASNMLYHSGLSIYCCLDAEVQAKVDDIYDDESFLAEYTSAQGQELLSAVTVVENTTGRVVALADSEEKTVNRGQVNATDALRQPGSAIKPLSVYAPALNEGLITPYSAVDDTPFTYDAETDTAWPRNSSGSYTGLTSIYTSVLKSINTSAVRTLDLLGLNTSYDYLQDRFGITSLVSYMVTGSGEAKSDIGYASLALGGLTNGVSTYEMAGAYSTFARDGVYIEPHMYTVVLDKDGNVLLSKEEEEIGSAAISEDANYYMNVLLTGVVSEGTGTGAKIPGMTVAGKTGTTTNDYDRWFCGYTGYYTAAVWTGYTYNEKINSSSNPAVSVWQRVMSSLVEGMEDIPLAYTTKNVVSATYCTKSGQLATKACSAAGCAETGTYLQGDAPTEYCTIHSTVTVCTESPVGDTGMYHVAGEYCPAESCKDLVVLDYYRDEAASSVTATDTYQLKSWVSSQGTCTVHTREWAEQVDKLRTQEILLPALSYEKEPGDEPFSLDARSQDGAGNVGGALSYATSDPDVVLVDENGIVTIVGTGSASITITAAPTAYAAAVSVTVTVDVVQQNGLWDEIMDEIFGGEGEFGESSADESDEGDGPDG